MNTEKIEKLKKSLSNSKIPADLKPKIEAEIKRLEDLDAKQSEPKEEEKEVKPVVKKTTTRKPRTTKTVAKKTSTAKPSQTSKPKRTAMSVAKEIRKEGESWKDAMARASKVMKEKSHTATKDVESELEKLTKLVRSKKELKGQVGRTNLLIDAKRKAKPMGRRVSKDGNVYYENRANRTDRGTYGKYHLAEGGYLTDPNFGNFQNTMFADGGGIPNNYEGKTPEQVWNSLSVKQREHFLLDHYYVDEDEFFQQQTKWLDSEDKKMIDYYSNKNWNKLSAEVKKAFTSHVKLGQYAKGGGIRRKNGQTYDYGRVWTKDHNEFDKGADHEVNYRRKKLAKGGAIKNQYAGRTPEDIWNSLSIEQRQHFLIDHFIEEEDEPQVKYKYLYDEDKEFIDEYSNKEWKKLSGDVRQAFRDHVKIGEYARGGGIRRKNGQTYDYGRVWTKDHNEFDKGADHEVNYRRKRFELGGNVVTDLAGHTGGSLGTGDPSMLDGFSNTSYTGLVGETGAMSSGEMFAKGGSVNSKFDLSGYKKFRTFNDLEEAKEYVDMDRKKYSRAKESVVIKEGNKFQVWVIPASGIETGNRVYEAGGGLPSGSSQSYMITESLGNPAQHFAKGGGIRRKNGQTYDYGRVWTKDHNEFDKGADHEVNYRRKGKFLGVFAGGGETYNEKASQLKGGVDYYSVDIDLENGDEVRDLTFKSLDKAKKEFLKYSNSMVYDGENIDDIQLVVSFKNGDYENIYLNKGGVMAKGGEIDLDYAKKEWGSYTKDAKINELIKSGYSKGVAQDLSLEAWESLEKNVQNDFKNNLISSNVKYMKDMMVSLYTYGGIERGSYDFNRYLLKYEDLLGKKLFDKTYKEELKRLEGYEIEQNTSTDSDGLTYNSLKRKMATGGGVNDESPKIYVADLEAYNNGRLSGVWLDLADYNDANELMEAIQDFLKTSGGEEYAIHDVEYIPNSMYSEYMGQKDFEELYEMIDLAKQNDLPLSVVQEVISQYDASAVDEFYGKYNDAEDFAIELVDEMGIESFIDFEYYLYITDTDRRLLAQDMADSYVEGIIDEDGGNRIIEEAGLDLDEYEEAESDRQEEMIDEAREIVYDEYYNTWIEGLSDPYYFLVEEQGMYDAESFANASFVRIDYEKLADALEQDYTFIYDGGSLYVFNIR